MCEAKESQMKKYLNKVRQLVKKFKEVIFVQLPKEENMEADALVKATSTREAIDEFDKIQYMPSIDLHNDGKNPHGGNSFQDSLWKWSSHTYRSAYGQSQGNEVSGWR